MRSVLVLNAGSSSLKFALYPLTGWRSGPFLRGQVEGFGGDVRFSVCTPAGEPLQQETLCQDRAPADAAGALALVLAWLRRHGHDAEIAAVGHRVVHGGAQFSAPVVLNDETLATLAGLEPLAPLHQPINIAVAHASRQHFPTALQVACFDTAFHRTTEWENEAFALPRELYEEGVRRYGFHGLSYEHVLRRLRTIAPAVAAGRVIIAHLGNGASMCAIKGGRSIASSMGFSALDGLPMGTRCGSLDPGVILYLLERKGMSVGELTDLLYKESGLKGLSGLSHDLRTLDASDDPRAIAAIRFFVARIRREIGAMAAVLGGLDGLVFTGGIGENSVTVRAGVCRKLDWLGIAVDEGLNGRGASELTAGGAAARVFCIPTDEEAVIARHTLAELAVAETHAIGPEALNALRTATGELRMAV